MTQTEIVPAARTKRAVFAASSGEGMIPIPSGTFRSADRVRLAGKPRLGLTN